MKEVHRREEINSNGLSLEKKLNVIGSTKKKSLAPIR